MTTFILPKEKEDLFINHTLSIYNYLDKEIIINILQKYQVQEGYRFDILMLAGDFKTIQILRDDTIKLIWKENQFYIQNIS